jgi:c(7)-type cytochrome triheme protein
MMRRLALTVLAVLACVLCFTMAFALPGDIVFPRKEMQELPSAVFPHWFHRMRFRCFVCHPQIFPMRVTSEGITMDEIRAGRFCGTCHNDKIAWRPSYDTCPRCHVIRDDAPE